ncbi:putative cathepsin H [Helianthus debilis subsp. tardiflorus]
MGVLLCFQVKHPQSNLILRHLRGSCAVGESSRGIGSIFANENLIRQVVSDGLREVETAVLQVIGETPHDLTFARFANRQVVSDGLREVETAVLQVIGELLMI